MATTLGELTREQMDMLARAVQTQEQLQIARMRIEADHAVLQRAVYDALMAGVPATLAASELGLSVGRVYQLKNAVDNHTTT